MDGQAHWRSFMRTRLREVGVSKRALSRALGRDESYISRLLEPAAGRPRPLPTPAELRIAAPLLQVPFLQLLAVVWDIRADDLERYYGGIAARQERAGVRCLDLTPSEQDELLDYWSYLLVRRTLRRTEPSQQNDAHLQDRVANGDGAGG
jgi:hypothetical protein